MTTQDKFEERLREIKTRLMEIEGVSGVGVGEHEGSLYIIVMLKEDNKHIRARIEHLMRDIPYRIEISGNFRPLRGMIDEP